jgi:hypothetical protein
MTSTFNRLSLFMTNWYYICSHEQFVRQACSKDYTYIWVEVTSMPIRTIYITAHSPYLVGMYCGACENIPLWRWLKWNQQFATSIVCYHYDREQLYNLQPNNFTDCFSVLCNILMIAVCHCLFFFFLSLCCLSFDLQLLITPLVWSNFSP